MAKSKKQIREAFRRAVFERDRYHCAICNRPGRDRQAKCAVPGLVVLDAHHITERSVMLGGGYVKKNGITVCDDCHLKAESGSISPDELYRMIGSSYDEAVEASGRLVSD